MFFFGYIKSIEAVHFLLFFCFGYLCTLAFGSKSGFYVLIVVALSDEVLQYFLPDRVGDIQDIMINTLFGLAGLFLGDRRT